MNCGNHSYLFLDACFISRLKEIDTSCELIDYFGQCASGAECVIDERQYSQGPCNNYEAHCKKLNDLFSDEESMKASFKAQKSRIDFSRVARDPKDIKAFLWVKNTDNAALYTCDSNLMLLCKTTNVPHCCFKAALKALDKWLGGAITEDTDYKTEKMEDGDNPFFHYNKNTKCDSHCGMNVICSCYYEL